MKKIKILFACVENSFRSQIAEGICKKYFSDKIIAYSAGSKPIDSINKNAKIILKEMNINPDEHYSKGFDEIEDNNFDYLVTMGCGDVCPFYPSKDYLEWNLPDIKNESLKKIRELKNEIKEKIEKLLINNNL